MSQNNRFKKSRGKKLKSEIGFVDQQQKNRQRNTVIMPKLNISSNLDIPNKETNLTSIAHDQNES